MLLLVPESKASVITRHGLTWVFGLAGIYGSRGLLARYELHQLLLYLYCPHCGHQISLLHCFLFYVTRISDNTDFYSLWPLHSLISVRFKLFHHDFLSVLDVETTSGLHNAAALEVIDSFIIYHFSFII